MHEACAQVTWSKLMGTGAQIIRNASENLSSNKSAGKKRADAQASQVSRDEEGDEDNDDDSGLLFDIKETPFCEHTHRHFHSEYIEAHYGFCTDELVLVALLAGGDYDVAGCANIGIVSAMALIESGFGRSLVDGYWRLRDDRIQLRAFLDDWRGEVAHELRTNSRGKMKTKKKKAADELDADSQFPSIVILEYYLEPVISELPPPEWSGFVDMSRLARLVQRNFEWGNEEVKQKLRNNIYQGLALEELRKAALVADTSGRMTPITAEEDSIFYKISDERCNKSTMYCPCYRVELAHVKLDKIVSAVLPEEDPFPIPTHTEDQAPGRRTKPIGPATTTDYRHWMPVAMVDQHPHARRLAELWKEKADEVRARKLAAEERKRQREESRSSSVSLGSSPRKASPVKMSPLKSSPLKSSPLKLSPLKASPWKSRHQSEPSSPSSTGRLDSFVRSSKPCLVGTNTNVIKPVLNGPSTTLSSSRASTINRDAADDWLERRPPPTLDLKAIFGSPIAAAGPSKGKKRSSTPPTRRASSDSDDDIIVLSPISHGGDLRKKRNVLANDPSAASGSLGKGKSKEVECIVLD